MWRGHSCPRKSNHGQISNSWFRTSPESKALGLRHRWTSAAEAAAGNSARSTQSKPPNLKQHHPGFFHVAETIRRDREQKHLGRVVADMYQKAGSYRSGGGAHRGADHSHQEDQKNHSPGVAILKHVDQAEGQRREKDSPSHSHASRQHGIEESAKEKFLHQRAEGDGEHRHKVGIAGPRE